MRSLPANLARVPRGEAREPGVGAEPNARRPVSLRVQQPRGVRVEPGQVDGDGRRAVDLEGSVGGLTDPRRRAGPRGDQEPGRMHDVVRKVARRDIEPPVGRGSWVGGQLLPQVQEGCRLVAHGDQVWTV